MIFRDESTHGRRGYAIIAVHTLDVGGQFVVGPPALKAERPDGRTNLIDCHERHNMLTHWQCQPEKSLPSGQLVVDRIFMVGKNPLLQWVEAEVRTRYGTMRDLARRINRTQSALKRGLEEGRVGVDTVLMLARESGESPGRLLSLAGKADVDALIRQLYGSESVSLPLDVQIVVDFLMADEPRLKAIQAGMIAHAKAMNTLRRLQSQEHEGSDATQEAPTGTRTRRGTRKQKAKRDDEQP